MAQQTLADLLAPVIQQLSETERQTLKWHLGQVKYWVDTVKSARAEVQKNEGKNERPISYEGFQQSFMVAVHEMNRWLARKNVFIEPRLIWPKDVPYLARMKLEPRLGTPREREIRMVRRVKGKEKPLNVRPVLRKLTDAEKKLGAGKHGKKGRRNKPLG